MNGAASPHMQRTRLEPLTQVGEGGQGFVHLTEAVKINKLWPVAYKEYKPGTAFDPVMLARMVAFVPGLDLDAGRWLCETTAWPAALIGRGAAVCGFLMRRIPDEFQQPWGEDGAVVPAAMQYLLNPQQYLDRKRIRIDNRQRLALLEDIADTLSRLHSLGIVVGDLSPNNLLVRLSGKPRCFFIDCDAMRLHGDDVLDQVETPEWRVPGPFEPNATPASDSYKFGLLAVRLFAQDQMGADVSALAGVSADLGVLARRSLDSNSTARPAPGDWLAALRAAQRGPSYKIKTAPAPVTPVPPPFVTPATTTVFFPTSTGGRATVPTQPQPQPATTYAPPPRQPVFSTPVRQPVQTGGGMVQRVIGALVLVLLIIAVIAIADNWASADDSAAAPAATVDSGLGSAARPAPSAGHGIVDYAAVADRPDAVRVAEMFATYFEAVNTRDWAALLAFYDPAGVIDPADPEQVEDFRHRMSTTRDSGARLRSIETAGDGTRARVTFTSRQAASFGPARDPRETCTRWDITFLLTTSDTGGLRILRSAAAKDRAC